MWVGLGSSTFVGTSAKVLSVQLLLRPQSNTPQAYYNPHAKYSPQPDGPKAYYNPQPDGPKAYYSPQAASCLLVA